MSSDNFIHTAHLYLGISRQELQRRLSSGQIDLQILKAQISQNAHETKLEALCEKWIDSHALDQFDKLSEVE